MDNAYKDQLENRTRQFAIDVIHLCAELEGVPGLRRVADQLVDAAGSVASNHRAMRRARSAREFAAKAHIVLEEADESLLWLEIVTRIRPRLAPAQAILLEASELRNLFSHIDATARQNKAHGNR
jgi:four helix bundle protein